MGLVPAGVDIGPTKARVGDAVLLSGPIGLHGVAVLSVRAHACAGLGAADTVATVRTLAT